MGLAWVLEDSEERHRYSADVAQAGLERRRQLIAPAIFHVECSYQLLKRGRAGRWGEARIAECAEVIDFFAVQPYAVQQTIVRVATDMRSCGHRINTRLGKWLVHCLPYCTERFAGFVDMC